MSNVPHVRRATLRRPCSLPIRRAIPPRRATPTSTLRTDRTNQRELLGCSRDVLPRGPNIAFRAVELEVGLDQRGVQDATGVSVGTVSRPQDERRGPASGDNGEPKKLQAVEWARVRADRCRQRKAANGSKRWFRIHGSHEAAKEKEELKAAPTIIEVRGAPRSDMRAR